MSDEDYAHLIGAHKAPGPRGSTALEQEDQSVIAERRVSVDGPWSSIKAPATDGNGDSIPIRQGNDKFGWQHFSGPHNIRNPRIVVVAISEHAEVRSGFRREYGAVVLNGSGDIVAQVHVIAWSNFMTQDKQYRLGDEQQNIGVITAYCQHARNNLCPDVVNTAR